MQSQRTKFRLHSMTNFLRRSVIICIYIMPALAFRTGWKFPATVSVNSKSVCCAHMDRRPEFSTRQIGQNVCPDFRDFRYALLKFDQNPLNKIHVDDQHALDYGPRASAAVRHIIQAVSASVLAVCMVTSTPSVADPVPPLPSEASSTTAVPAAPSAPSLAPKIKDAEHQYLDEVLDTVEDHFLDLNNAKGVADSSRTKTFNGVSWAQIRREFDTVELATRDDTYRAVRKLLARLGDRFTRLMPPQEFAKLTKYDMTGVGILLLERDGNLYLAAPPLAGSTGAEAGLRKGDRVLAIDGVDMAGRCIPPYPPRSCVEQLALSL